MDDKNLYTLEDIISDPTFINWVKDKCPKNDYWSKRLDTQPKLISSAIKQLKSIQFVEELDTESKQRQIWSNINDNIASENMSKVSTDKNRRSVIYLLAAAAACALALLMILPIGTADYQTDLAADSNTISILPDDSEVSLRKGSSISYQKNTWDKDRSIELKGEAFFKVEKGQRFTVNTESIKVEVLGTSFNIQEKSNGTEVICLTGKVKVTNKSNSTHEVISQNQSVVVNSNTIIKTDHKYPVYVPWQEASFSYSDAELASVVKDIEEAFGVTIHLNDIGTRNYNGSFEKKTLESALENIVYVMDLEYIIDNKEVTIFNK